MLFSAGSKSLALVVCWIATLVVASSPLATITPCPECPSSIAPPPITVTSQYQTVSTCEPSSSCTVEHHHRKDTTKCHIVPSVISKYAFVSTVIPARDNQRRVTVTKTDQRVQLQYHSTVYTSTIPCTTSPPQWNPSKGYQNTTTTCLPTTEFHTKITDISCPYNQIGPWGDYGYGGSGLCEACKPDENGDTHQNATITIIYDGKTTIETQTWSSLGTKTVSPTTTQLPTITTSDEPYPVITPAEPTTSTSIDPYSSTTPESAMPTSDEPPSITTPEESATPTPDEPSSLAPPEESTTQAPDEPYSMTTPPQPIMTSTPPGAGTCEYKGCYGNTRVFFPSFHMAPWSAGKMTGDKCIDDCQVIGKPFAGVYRTDCYCGDNIDQVHEYASNECAAPCPGDPSTVCGGGDRLGLFLLSVYECFDEEPTSTTTTSEEPTPEPSSGPDPEPEKRGINADTEVSNRHSKPLARRNNTPSMSNNLRRGVIRSSKSKTVVGGGNSQKRDLGLKKNSLLDNRI